MFSNSPPNKDIDILVREDNLEVGKNCDVIHDDLKLQRSFVRAVRIGIVKNKISYRYFVSVWYSDARS